MLSVNGIPVEYTLFNDNTSQIWHLPENITKLDWAIIEWEFFHEMEIMHLAQLKDLLDAWNTKTVLEIKYLPYARQDKNISNDTTFALHTFAKILNAMNFYSIKILDPHSEVALNLIKNSSAVYPVEQVKQAIQLVNADGIVYPDKGASIKYDKIYEFPSISGEKVRDQATGKINKLVVPDAKRVTGGNILIVDDIMDGGATFILLAQILRFYTPKEMNLFVTHGIFSKGLKKLREEGIKRIFTAEGEVMGNDRSSLTIVPFEELSKQKVS